MTRELVPLDISSMPDLVRLVDEVRSTGVSRILTWENKDVAILSPAPPRRRRTLRTPSTEDVEAFRALAGSWEGLIDREKFLADIAESRRSSRPPVKL